MNIALTAAAVLLITARLGADGAAQIYVYARRDTAARSWLPISCGNAVVAEIRQGAFFALNVVPGRYTLSVDQGVPLVVEVHSDEKTFVRLQWNYGIDRSPIPVLSAVSDTEAREEMKYLSYIGKKRIHSNLVSETDPIELIQPRLRTRDR